MIGLCSKSPFKYYAVVCSAIFRNFSSAASKNYDLTSLMKLDQERLAYRVMRLQRLVNYYERTSSPVKICGKDKVRVEYPDPDQILRSLTPMRKIALKVLYLGWDYTAYAWEDRSKGQKFAGSTNVVERVLMEALSRQQLVPSLTNNARMNWSRCGRTDADVSSTSQVVTVRVRSNLNEGYGVWDVTHNEGGEEDPDDCPDGRKRVFQQTYHEEGFRFDDTSLDKGEIPYVKLLNEALPTDIRVLAWAPVSKSFNPRYDCRGRTYRYVMARGQLDVDLMNEAAQKLVGFHDFRNFSKRTEQNLYKVFTREICSFQFDPLRPNQFDDSDLIVATIKGKSFLHNQIRMMMAVLVWIGSGRMKASFIDELLDIERTPRKPSYDITKALNLTLVDCAYDSDALHWRWNDLEMTSTAQAIAEQFADHAVKAEVLRYMYEEVKGRIGDAGLRKSCGETLTASSLKSHFMDLNVDYELSKSIEEKQKSLERGRVRKLIKQGSHFKAAKLFDELNRPDDEDRGPDGGGDVLAREDAS